MRNPLHSLALAVASLWRRPAPTRSAAPAAPASGSRRVPASRSLIDVRELLRQTSDSLRTQLKAAGMALNLELPAQALVVPLDRSRMQEVFTQIVQLASRAMPPGSTLKLLARMDGKQAVVNIIDAPASGDAPRLGECFDAASATRTDADPGAASEWARAVALCNRIVGEHRGRIYASPSPLGSLGITLRLPLGQA